MLVRFYRMGTQVRNVSYASIAIVKATRRLYSELPTLGIFFQMKCAFSPLNRNSNIFQDFVLVSRFSFAINLTKSTFRIFKVFFFFWRICLNITYLVPTQNLWSLQIFRQLSLLIISSKFQDFNNNRQKTKTKVIRSKNKKIKIYDLRTE